MGPTMGISSVTNRTYVDLFEHQIYVVPVGNRHFLHSHIHTFTRSRIHPFTHSPVHALSNFRRAGSARLWPVGHLPISPDHSHISQFSYQAEQRCNLNCCGFHPQNGRAKRHGLIALLFCQVNFFVRQSTFWPNQRKRRFFL